MNIATWCRRWCGRADALLDIPGIHVIAVENTARERIVSVETDQILAGCPVCGVVAIGHGRRVVRLHDTPAHGRPVRVDWAKRIWRCADPHCPAGTFTETHALAPAKAKLTTRAITWATDALSRCDTSVSALAYQLGVSWHSLWKPVKAEAERRTNITDRLAGVDALGVDEHLWVHTGFPGSGMVTGIINHTRDTNGVVHARLLDLVEGRSGRTSADWLKAQSPEFRAGIKVATLDPFRGYADAIRDALPDAVQVLDAFHVVKLASAMVDDVRRRVQQDTLGAPRTQGRSTVSDPPFPADRCRAPE